MDIIKVIQSIVEELECGVEYTIIPNPVKGGFIVIKEEESEERDSLKP